MDGYVRYRRPGPGRRVRFAARLVLGTGLLIVTVVGAIALAGAAIAAI